MASMTGSNDATTQCLYASKPCTNTRSTKPDGQLHRLCLHHRSRANAAQRRWHTRQRQSGGGGVDVPANEPPTVSVLSKRRLLFELACTPPSKRSRAHTVKQEGVPVATVETVILPAVSPTPVADFSIESMKPITNEAIWDPTGSYGEDLDLELLSAFLFDAGDITNLPAFNTMGGFAGEQDTDWSIANQCFLQPTEFVL